MQGLTIIASRTNRHNTTPTVMLRKTGIRFNAAAMGLIGKIRHFSLATDGSDYYLISDDASGYALSEFVATESINRFIGTINTKVISEALQKFMPNQQSWVLEKIDDETFKLCST